MVKGWIRDNLSPLTKKLQDRIIMSLSSLPHFNTNYESVMKHNKQNIIISHFTVI